jgi:AraC-like DNA-binding protein
VLFLVEDGTRRRGAVEMDGCCASLCHIGSNLHIAHVPSGTRIFAGVLLRPGAFRHRDDLPGMSSSPERLIALEELWGSNARLLLHRMVDATTIPRRLEILQKAVYEYCVRKDHHDGFCLSATELIDASGGTVRTDELETRTGYSARTVRQKFEDWLGLSPKQYARISRLHRCIMLAEQSDRPIWSSVAAEAGYADQSHLVHDFQELLGKPPGIFLSEAQAAARHGRLIDETGNSVSLSSLGLVLWPRNAK